MPSIKGFVRRMKRSGGSSHGSEQPPAVNPAQVDQIRQMKSLVRLLEYSAAQLFPNPTDSPLAPEFGGITDSKSGKPKLSQKVLDALEEELKRTPLGSLTAKYNEVCGVGTADEDLEQFFFLAKGGTSINEYGAEHPVMKEAKDARRILNEGLSTFNEHWRWHLD